MIADGTHVDQRIGIDNRIVDWPQIILVGTDRGHCFISSLGITSRQQAVDWDIPAAPPKCIDLLSKVHVDENCSYFIQKNSTNSTDFVGK